MQVNIESLKLELEEFKYLQTLNPYYLSFELLYLYKTNYLNRISKDLQFPIKTNGKEYKKIIQTNSNSKYINFLSTTSLDKDIYKVTNES